MKKLILTFFLTALSQFGQPLTIKKIFFILLVIFTLESHVFLNYLNLESKYPKLAKFIAIRRKFQKYYLILNIAYLMFVGIVLFSTGIALFYL